MRAIVHLSDLHFGALDPRLVDPLVEAVTSIAPNLVALSGDLTQRARSSQFRDARAFLDRLPFPSIVVPGNHDVPLYNVAERFVDPYGRFRRYISNDLAPVFADDQIVVAALNSARAILFRHGRGRVNRDQVMRAAGVLSAAPPGAIRIVVSHHPFDLPAGHHEQHLIGRADMAMRALASAGVDLFLAGHLHVSHVGHTIARYKIAGHSALVVQAGTISTRGRGELNSFNVIRIEAPALDLERWSWNSARGRFEGAPSIRFERRADGWTPRPEGGC